MKFFYSTLFFCTINFIGHTQTPFECDGTFYTANHGYIAELEFDWANDTFYFHPLPGIIPDNMDAIGYNPMDNFIYGLLYENDYHLLYQIDASGQAYLIDTVFINNSIYNSKIFAGTFNEQGEYKVVLRPNVISEPSFLGTIDVHSGNIEMELLQTVNPDLIYLSTPDIAYNPIDGRYYGTESRNVPYIYESVFYIDEDSLLINNEFQPFEDLVGVFLGANGFFFNSFGGFFGVGGANFVAKGYEFDITNNIQIGVQIDHNSWDDPIRDACSCPYTIKLNHTITPDTALACTTVPFTYTFSNFSRDEQTNVTFSEMLPPGFTVTEIIRNPYGGTVSGLGTGAITINDMELTYGIDSLQLMVLLPEDNTGTFYSQASISNLDLSSSNSPVTGVVSNNPLTVEKGDSTPITVLPFEVAISDEVFYKCTMDTITIAPLANYSNVFFEWNTGSTDSVLQVSMSGDYSVTISAGCNEASANFRVEDAIPSIDIEASLFLCYGDETHLDPTITSSLPIESYQWDITDDLYNLLSCDTCGSTTLTAATNGNIKFSVTNEMGCISTKDISLFVQRNIYAPNIFSPNNDGINDIFYLQSKNPVAIKRMQVFDRWGGLLFEQSNAVTNTPSQGWQPNRNNNLIDAGTYIWFAEIEFISGQLEVFEGSIVLVR